MIILRDVAKSLVDAHEDSVDVKVKVIGEAIDRDALEAEREKLVARLAEIDAILAG